MACQAQGWLLAAAVFCLLALFYFPKNSSLYFVLPFTVWDGALNFCLEKHNAFLPCSACCSNNSLMSLFCNFPHLVDLSNIPSVVLSCSHRGFFFLRADLESFSFSSLPLLFGPSTLGKMLRNPLLGKCLCIGLVSIVLISTAGV